MRVIAERLHDWGILPVDVEESLSPEGQQHRRWLACGVAHHLGLDVHDCAQARYESYQGAAIRPGMIFTIEPGLYFREDDLLIPPEYRGIGIRVEDDVLMTEDGRNGFPPAFQSRSMRSKSGWPAWLPKVQRPDMPTPEFILELRKKVGHDLLWLMGVSGYVEDEQGRVLLGRRSDTGEWAMVYGINEPGEEPADTVAREVKEETGVDVIVTDLVSVKSSARCLRMRTATTPCIWITCSCASPIRMVMPNRS